MTENTTTIENNDVIAPNLKFDQVEGTLAVPTAKTDAKAKGPRDLTFLKDKAPTNLHTHYTAWIAEKTGFTFSDETEAAKIVQLAVSAYHDYQASAENKARREAEQANKTPKAPSKVKQELAAKDAEIEALKAQLAAAAATPATKSAPAARKSAAVK